MAIAAMSTFSDPVSIRERPDCSSVDHPRSHRRASAADRVEEDRRVEIETEAASGTATTAMVPATEAQEQELASALAQRRADMEAEEARQIAAFAREEQSGAAATAMEPETEARGLPIASAEEQRRAGKEAECISGHCHETTAGPGGEGSACVRRDETDPPTGRTACGACAR